MRISFQEELESLERAIDELAELVLRSLRAAVEALVTRDVELADEVIAFDDDVDDVYLRTAQAVELGPENLEWSLRMIVASRCLERIGDHAVDIGEQAAFLATGEFREFTDASHDVVGES